MMRSKSCSRKKRKMMWSKKVILKSSDGESFVVDEAVALESQTIKQMMEDYCADDGIPLPKTNSKILSKVIEYCKKHIESPKSDDRTADEELRTWDAEFVKVDMDTLVDLAMVESPKSDDRTADEELRTWDAEFVKVDMDTLVDLGMATNYLKIESLQDLLSQAIAGMMKGKTVEELREMFHIKDSGFTPEEEEQIRRNFQWAFE